LVGGAHGAKGIEATANSIETQPAIVDFDKDRSIVGRSSRSQTSGWQQRDRAA
jgi:hypothetical protein